MKIRVRDLHDFDGEQGRPSRILTSMFAPKRPLPVAVGGPMRQDSAHHSVAAQIRVTPSSSRTGVEVGRGSKSCHRERVVFNVGPWKYDCCTA